MPAIRNEKEAVSAYKMWLKSRGWKAEAKIERIKLTHSGDYDIVGVIPYGLFRVYMDGNIEDVFVTFDDNI